MATLTLYPSNDGTFIGKINVTLDDNKNKNQISSDDIETIIILDVSGSMGNNVPKLVNRVLPMMLKRLGYTENNNICLITFSDGAAMKKYTIKGLEQLQMRAGGGTYMKHAVFALKEYLTNYKKTYSTNMRYIRLLTLSDGDLSDQTETIKDCTALAQEIPNNYVINSTAIRFFTSGQPDTRGLSAVLQLNTFTEAKLCDVVSSYDDTGIADQFADVFKNDSMGYRNVMKIDEQLILPTPWEVDNAISEINLSVGENVVWFKNIPQNVSINGVPVTVDVSDLNDKNMRDVLNVKINYYFNQLKILKVINTADSNKKIENIVKYFTGLEKSLETSDVDLVKLLDDGSLRGRMEFFKNIVKKRTKSVATAMSQIANDNMVAKLNSAQQADYLRNVDVTKNAKGLARIAMNNGIDFNETVRKEIRDMHSHLSELDDIDDSDHTLSFFSQGTTLSGIKTVCELIDEDILDDIDITDILKMINIVGIACNGEIGDYPDPMTWRVNNIFAGCFVSLSDVLMVHSMTKGNKLKAPGIDTKYNEITNVIPFFDDDRIHQFMRKYAPSLLEYISSVGMRRIIADVPMTYGYTVAAGIWKLVEVIDKTKTEVNIMTFVKLIKTFQIAVGKYFDHILEHATKKQSDDLSFYIANNGITNMINPLVKLIKVDNFENMDKIMRAIYSYEVYQATRRLGKSSPNPEIFATDMLSKLNGIDLSDPSRNIKVTDLFEDDHNLTPDSIYSQYHVDQQLLDDTIKAFWYLDYMTLLPELIKGVFQANPVEYIKQLPQMNDKSICDALGLDINKYSLRDFKFYNIVQSYMFNSKAERVDDENFKMKIIDLVNKDGAEKLVRIDYVKKRYNDKYHTDVNAKRKQEIEKMKNMLVNKLLETDSLDEFVQLIKNGMTKNKTSHSIVNSSSYGCYELQSGLFDLSGNVPLRTKKIQILILGNDLNGSYVWNNGNVLHVNANELSNLFNELGENQVWNEIYEEYKTRNIHIYRGVENRHGHSNDKPSFWAMGYSSLEDMVRGISSSEWNTYKQNHHNCCGVKTFYSKGVQNSC
ncbi:MAG: hypothetical protein Terrestrivirus5_102 [Terrestrivirus sp.]|uniref:VWFA domain-containing protein n=1 Tax=Terrestrivirus sp. TaxID=2487775 RepID=A0A3G4ZN32_9VIRU|nr:MAG: hypothetical protein Terrestrivirus5_102 [Terrestrivirus sp.]